MQKIIWFDLRDLQFSNRKFGKLKTKYRVFFNWKKINNLIFVSCDKNVCLKICTCKRSGSLSSIECTSGSWTRNQTHALTKVSYIIELFCCGFYLIVCTLYTHWSTLFNDSQIESKSCYKTKLVNTFLYVVHVYMFCNVVLYCITLLARVLFAIKIIIL